LLATCKENFIISACFFVHASMKIRRRKQLKELRGRVAVWCQVGMSCNESSFKPWHYENREILFKSQIKKKRQCSCSVESVKRTKLMRVSFKWSCLFDQPHWRISCYTTINYHCLTSTHPV
jgi:hypothetical protein